MEIIKLQEFYKKRITNFVIVGKKELLYFVLINVLIYFIVVIISNKVILLSVITNLFFFIYLLFSLNVYCKTIIKRKYKLDFKGYNWQKAVYNLKLNRLKSYLIKHKLYRSEKISLLIEAINLEANDHRKFAFPFGKEIFTIFITVTTIVLTISFSNLIRIEDLERILTSFTYISIGILLMSILTIYLVASFIEIIFDTSKSNLKVLRRLLIDLMLRM